MRVVYKVEAVRQDITRRGYDNNDKPEKIGEKTVYHVVEISGNGRKYSVSRCFNSENAAKAHLKDILKVKKMKLPSLKAKLTKLNTKLKKLEKDKKAIECDIWEVEDYICIKENLL